MWRPAEREERGANLPAKEEEEEEEVFSLLALALGMVRGCWTLNCFRGRMGSVGCEILHRGWEQGNEG